VLRSLRSLLAMIYHAAAELERTTAALPGPSEIAQRLGVDLEVVLEELAAQGAGTPAHLTNRHETTTGRMIGAGSVTRSG